MPLPNYFLINFIQMPIQNPKKRVIGVQLGRVAPYTKGHHMVTRAIQERFGNENTMMLIGSSNVPVNERTPFTYEQRAEMVRTLHPELIIAPLPDINPHRKKCTENTFEKWRAQIMDLMRSMEVEFVFCGGSPEDLAPLEPDFRTEIVVDRFVEGKGINATEVRRAIQEKDMDTLREALNEEIIDLAVTFFKENETEIKMNRELFETVAI